ncbi:hypothetical protein ACFSKS_13630 [Pseudocitrobacter faecalis]
MIWASAFISRKPFGLPLRQALFSLPFTQISTAMLAPLFAGVNNFINDDPIVGMSLIVGRIRVLLSGKHERGTV